MTKTRNIRKMRLKTVHAKMPVMYDIATTAERSNLTQFTLRKLCRQGKISYIRTGEGERGKILINFDSLCNYLNGGMGE